MDIVKKYFPNITSQQITQFAYLKDLYAEWNEKINVISRKDMENFYEHHVLHSLSIARIFSFPDRYEIMDLGSGGGFPGIPLAILFPKVNFYLVDSIRKKMLVAAEIAKAIGLTNITTKHARAETFHNQQFNFVVSRAVAPLKDLYKLSKPLIKRNDDDENLRGLICLKGGDLNTEIKESNCTPEIYKIEDFFEEEFLKRSISYLFINNFKIYKTINI